jgi:DUF1365 family protein
MSTAVFRSALYEGTVIHTRLRPRRHRLSYRTFAMLLDLDELDRLGQGLRLFSRNGFNLFSFHDRDHGDGAGPIRAYVERELAKACIDISGGRIELFCLPRILGYVFNPISIYYCYRADGTLAAMLHEVTNTFGQRHSYLGAAEADEKGLVRQSCAKELYVSPFMAMDMTYDFRLTLPGERISIGIGGRDAHGLLIMAVQSATRRALTDRALAGAFLRHPLLTLKVVGSIHWEALKLWLKGIALVRRPAPPAHVVTVLPASPTSPRS